MIAVHKSPMSLFYRQQQLGSATYRVGEVTFEKELSYNYSYFWARGVHLRSKSALVTDAKSESP